MKNSKKILTVNEFDVITANKYYNNKYYNDKYKVLDNEQLFNELISFIHEFAADKNNVDALELMKISYKRGLEYTVQINNYVGLIQLKSGFQIEILPKILLANSDNEINETRKIFLNMLRTMKDFPNKTFNSANLNFSTLNIYEIYIYMYIQQVNDLIRKGLKSSYINKQDNLDILKGKLLLKENIKNNIVHKEKFYCLYDEYQLNRPENKIIKSTLIKLLEISKNNKNIKLIRQLLGYFDLVQPSINYESDFSKIIMTREMKDYNLLMIWSEIFLKNKSFTTFSGTSNARALLYRMDKLFESYVAKKIRKKANSEWQISTQDNKYYLFDNSNDTYRKFHLIPDIVITKENGTKVILDTKWKELDSNKKNYGISTQDMYQMYVYAKKYNTPYIWLLYPVTDKIKESNIFFKSNDNVFVNIFFVDFNDIEKSIDTLLEKIKLQN